MKPFENKVALITGSSMGIGKATARALAERGAKIVINGRDRAKLQKTKQELLNRGFEVLALPGDVRYHQQCKTLIQETIKAFGRLDILINNAAVASRGSVEDMAPKNVKILIDSNYSGSAYLAKYAIPFLKKSKGSIIFINSVGGYRGMPYNSAYTASKMAQAALADALRIEVYDYGIHVGLIYVGYTENDSRKKILDVDGRWIYLPKRNNVRLTPRKFVAKQICKMVQQRTKQMTLTPLGWFTAIMTRYLPRISDWLLRINRKKINEEFTLIGGTPAIEPRAVDASQNGEQQRVEKYQKDHH